VYFFSSFTVNSGHTVTLSSGLTRIYCSGPVTITGTLTVNTFLSTNNDAEGGSLVASTGYITEKGVGIGRDRGAVYTWEAQPYGSSGGGPNYRASSSTTGVPNMSGGKGGDGGGGLFIEAAGAVVLNGTIQAIGGNASIATLTDQNMQISGASGGSGGLVHLSSLISITRNNGSTLSVRGGNGANALRGSLSPANTFSTNGGEAGGGGYIVLIAPTITTNGTVTTTLSPGTRGADVGTFPGWGANGGASFGGRGGNGRTPFEAAQSGQLITRLIKPVA
jgi:hypothetical protein